MKSLSLVAIGLTLLLAPVASAAPADLDPSFSQDGVVTLDAGGAEYAQALAVEPNGHILVAGRTSTGLDSIVWRLRSTGTPDPSFNGTGRRRIHESGSEELNAVVRQPDGKILVAGRTENAVVYRLNPNGSLDKTFNKTGRKLLDVGAAKAMVLQPDGKILVAGSTFGGDVVVWRLTPGGALDKTFNGTGRVRIPSADSEIGWAMARQADGKIVLAVGTHADLRIAAYRLKPNGALDPTFGSGGRVAFEHAVIERVRGVAIQPDGKIVLAGETGINALVYRLRPNGSPDASFAGTGRLLVNGIEEASAVLLQPDGRIVIGGSIGLDAAIARINPDGSPDTSFDGDGARRIDLGMSEGILALARQSNGRILAAGWTTFNDNATIYRFMGGDGAAARTP